MLDFFCIFTTGGLILWYKKYVGTIKIELLINNLIKNVLLDEKRTQEFHTVTGSVMRWRTINEVGLIFLVAYQEMFNVLYTDKLLDMVVEDFINDQKSQLKKIGNAFAEKSNYNESFLKIHKKWEKYCENELNSNNKNTPKDFKKKSKGGDPENKNKKDSNADIFDEEFNANNENKASLLNEEENLRGSAGDFKKYNPNIPKKNQMNRSAGPSSKKNPKEQPKKKEGRIWDNEFNQVTNVNIKKFDHSKQTGEETQDMDKKNIFIGPADPDNLLDKSIDEYSSDEEDTINVGEAPKKSGLFSRLTSSLKNYIGNKVLTEEDLQPIMKEFVTLLMEKNVAKEIAENLCNSVSKSLLKTKTQSFTTITTTVKNAIKETISKILTPKQEFDVLKQALAARKRGEPYKIVFIGVNGVGKSTNLAKVGYLLMNNGLKILIAACDNFRSGAVEQLKTHSRALGVDLFDKGYKDDPAYICKEAIEDAKKRGYDCVLIDTAGRMQDNEPLMKSLAKLVEINQPDAILFVGEALTGNDSVDQLRKFNQALIDFSKKEEPRTIDGILLTKFDTVDDKVGAALTMVYTTGKPVVFVGTGQKYTNLKKLNVNNVLNALFG
jgi:signal recognition particle receptor subunit alpha